MHTVAKVVLLASLACLLLAHTAILARLAFRSTPRRRALAALLLPPLAPWWALRQGWRSGYAWVAALLGYAAALLTLLSPG